MVGCGVKGGRLIVDQQREVNLGEYSCCSMPSGGQGARSVCWSSNDGDGDGQPFMDARADSIYVQSLVKSSVYASFVVSILGGEVRMEYYGWWYWSTAVEYFLAGCSWAE